MTRITTSTFDSVIDEFRRDPFNVGFDSLCDRLVDFQTTVIPTQKIGYPHYNVVKVGEDEFVIELALAGFLEENLSVTVKEHNLEVKGALSCTLIGFQKGNQHYIERQYHCLLG